MNLASWKRECLSGAKAHNLTGGISVPTDRIAIGIDAFEKAHGLKEFKPIRLVEKLLC